jgi:hypothetical protein
MITIGTTERIRCKATYAVNSTGRALNQSLRCASDSYRTIILDPGNYGPFNFLFTFGFASLTPWAATMIHFLMIVLGCRCDLVWHLGRKGNGDGKANHGNDERGY